MRKDLSKQIGSEVRRQRELLGLTQDSASELLGISTQFLSEIERGVKGISAETLYKICKNMGISADNILFGDKSVSDISRLINMISNMDEKFIPLFEEITVAFIKTIQLQERTNKGD